MRTAILAVLSVTAAFSFQAKEDGPPAPPFSILRAGTAQPLVQLGALRGKTVVIALIDTDCSHCQDLTRNVLIPVAHEYGPRGVEVAECAFNDFASQEVPKFIQKFLPPFPVGWNTRAAVNAFLQISVLDRRPLYVPHLVFLDRRGAIVGDYRGESEFLQKPDVNVRAELDRILKPAVMTKSLPPRKK
jgi:hypothetical protein